MTRSSPQLENAKLLAELRIHQAELEAQNAALRGARDAAEEALANYTDLYEFAPVGYATVLADGTVAAANLSLAALFGVERSRLIGRPLLQWIGRADRTAVVDFLKRVREGDSDASLEAGAVTAGGGLLTVALTAVKIAGAETLRVAIANETRRHAAELAFQQSQKMEAIGRLAGGIAHDLNNLLTVVGVHTEFVASAMDAQSAEQEDLQAVQMAVAQATALTSRLMAFARPQLLSRRLISINGVIEDFTRLIKRVLPEQVMIETHLDAAAGDITADPVQIEQVLMNLATNASTAMPRGGRLSLETAVVTLSRADVEGRPGVHHGEFVRLRAADTGVGMRPEVLARIFEPFFTMRAGGKGTGLGLATVYAIATQGGGFVTVASTEGQGSTFDVFLPRMSGIAAPTSVQAVAVPNRGTETILIVDDEAQIRHLAQRALSRLGYTCRVAGDGEEAMQRIREFGGDVQLVLTDVVMPKLSGPDFVRQMRKTYPGIPVVFMTGYASSDQFRNSVIPPHVGVLHKPFSVSALGTIVRKGLDGK